jgi:hypothetical protein
MTSNQTIRAENVCCIYRLTWPTFKGRKLQDEFLSLNTEEVCFLTVSRKKHFQNLLIYRSVSTSQQFIEALNL